MPTSGFTSFSPSSTRGLPAEDESDEHLPTSQALIAIGSSTACLWILIALAVHWFLA